MAREHGGRSFSRCVPAGWNFCVASTRAKHFAVACWSVSRLVWGTGAAETLEHLDKILSRELFSREGRGQF